ncbi:hypothetical protein N7488_003776 [Penicillium malachiteum]|nr:hypothetical protein N7488_003776 [Penicillium malachiteum]
MLGFASFGIAWALVFVVVRTIYRLYFHPLKNVPGPKLAAASSAYEFYFNVIKGGKYIWEVERLHKIYGPIVRISPREVHINDVKYYEEIYAPATRKRDKVREWVEGFDLNGSVVASVSADLHRQRRVPINKFFSKSAITNIEPMIQEKIDQLCNHLKTAYKSQRVVNLDSGFAGLTSDIIHQYTIGYHSGNLDQQDFNIGVRDAMNGLFQGVHVLFFLPFLAPIAGTIPLSILKSILPYFAAFKEQKIAIHTQIVKILAGEEEKDKSMIMTLAHHSSDLPDGFLDPSRLTDEAMTILTAGTETTARALTFAIFNIIQSQEVQEKLREELKTVMPTPQSLPTWDQLKQLPYLNGVIYESIRLSTGLASRTPRIAPEETMVYKNFVLPPGTILSQWHYFLLTDPEIYPNPHAFDPERWIRETDNGERLDRYFIPFSKGPRMCIGFNLAYAELYLVVARLARQFDFTLYDTTEKNLEFARDFQGAFPEDGNIIMQVKVSNMIDD